MNFLTYGLTLRTRRVISRSRRLRDLMWPSTDEGLRRRRDGVLVVAAAFRTLVGREPTPAERAELLGRAKHDDLDFDGLVDELRSTAEVLDRSLTRAPQELRQVMEKQFRPDEESAGNGPGRLLLLHVMKTGGTSLSDLLERWAGASRARVGIPLDDLLVMPRPQLGRLRAVAGHIPYEALSVLPVRFRTVIVLREPVSRTLSHYREVQRSPVAGPELTLDEFVSNEAFDVPSGNYQARSLAHSIDLPDAWIGYSPMQRYLAAGGDPYQPYPLQSLFDSTPITMGEERLHETASRNLSELDYVGVTEDLEALAGRLAHLFDVSRIQVPRLNTSQGPGIADLPAALRRRIEQRTAVDRELYDQALALSRS